MENCGDFYIWDETEITENILRVCLHSYFVLAFVFEPIGCCSLVGLLCWVVRKWPRKGKNFAWERLGVEWLCCGGLGFTLDFVKRVARDCETW